MKTNYLRLSYLTILNPTKANLIIYMFCARVLIILVTKRNICKYLNSVENNYLEIFEDIFFSEKLIEIFCSSNDKLHKMPFDILILSFLDSSSEEAREKHSIFIGARCVISYRKKTNIFELFP